MKPHLNYGSDVVIHFAAAEAGKKLLYLQKKHGETILKFSICRAGQLENAGETKQYNDDPKNYLSRVDHGLYQRLIEALTMMVNRIAPETEQELRDDPTIHHGLDCNNAVCFLSMTAVHGLWCTSWYRFYLVLHI